MISVICIVMCIININSIIIIIISIIIITSSSSSRIGINGGGGIRQQALVSPSKSTVARMCLAAT